jgi:3D (Asp-Asp-Asp) domain-containing protein
MKYSTKRVIVLLLLLSGSSALILKPTASPGFRDVAKLLPKTENIALTALVAPTPVVIQETIAPSVRPIRLAPPIPLPARRFRTVSKVTRKPIRSKPRTRTLRMLVTAYCPCKICCGKFSDNVTASGKSIYTNRSMFVAADTSLLKFGTMLSIPGYRGGQAVPVLDRGSKIRGYHLDVFYQSHRQAQKWGKQYLNVKVSLN